MNDGVFSICQPIPLLPRVLSWLGWMGKPAMSWDGHVVSDNDYEMDAAAAAAAAADDL